MNNLTIKIKSNNKIIGIQILRTILCFWVVLDHLLCNKYRNKYHIFFRIRLHVPCFILISFYFSFRTISERNFEKIKKRFERLLIPYLIFPIIILVINNICFTLLNSSIFGYSFSFYDLILQYIIGRKIIGVFWFQFFLIWATLLFVIISILFKEQYIFILELLYIITYYLRYSNINYNLFLKYSWLIRLSVGQFIEVLPLSLSGSILSSINIFSILKNKTKKTILFSFSCLFFIYKFNIFYEINSFAFDGIILEIGSVLAFIIFYLLGHDYEINQSLNNIINNITKYTNGIYIMHYMLIKALIKRINIVKSGTVLGCVFIYNISYFLSLIGEKLSKNTKLIYLFI